MHVQPRVFIVVLAISLISCGQASQPTTPDAAVGGDSPTEIAVTSTPLPAVTQPAEPTATAVAALPVKEVYSPGDTAPLARFQITATQAESAPQPESGDPQEGRRFVPLNITLLNTAGEPEEVALLLQLVLEDGAGNGYTLDPGASMGAVMSLNGRIDAGEQTEGIVVFQVPEAADDLRLIFRTIEPGAAVETGRVVFALAD